MKKTLMFALAASMMLVSCGGAGKSADQTKSAADSTAVTDVQVVASGDVVFVDIDYVMASSKLYAAEGKVVEEKLQKFQEKMQTSQQSWAKKEQNLAAEYNKLQKDAAKLQEDYQKGLITTLNAQQKQEELQKKGASIEARMNSYQTSAQSEAQTLQNEEMQLVEEQQVLLNRFQTLVKDAIAELNADKRYKMIINAVQVVDADPSLDISPLVLDKVDALYDAGHLTSNAE